MENGSSPWLPKEHMTYGWKIDHLHVLLKSTWHTHGKWVNAMASWRAHDIWMGNGSSPCLKNRKHVNQVDEKWLIPTVILQRKLLFWQQISPYTKCLGSGTGDPCLCSSILTLCAATDVSKKQILLTVSLVVRMAVCMITQSPHFWTTPSQQDQSDKLPLKIWNKNDC